MKLKLKGCSMSTPSEKEAACICNIPDQRAITIMNLLSSAERSNLPKLFNAQRRFMNLIKIAKIKF